MEAIQETKKRQSWRMLILHFLGLDHIGHVEGPFSAKVPGKLKEMDLTIWDINSHLDRFVRLIKKNVEQPLKAKPSFNSNRFLDFRGIPRKLRTCSS